MRFQVQRFFSTLIMRNRLWSRIRTMWEYFDSEIDVNEHELALLMTEQKIKYFPHSPCMYCAITYHRDNRYSAILVECIFCSTHSINLCKKKKRWNRFENQFPSFASNREKSRKEKEENKTCKIWSVYETFGYHHIGYENDRDVYSSISMLAHVTKHLTTSYSSHVTFWYRPRIVPFFGYRTNKQNRYNFKAI